VTTANLAYVIYTSGSTGQPKGAMNTHSAICNRLLWMQETYNLSRTDHILQKTPFSFDVSVWEFFWPLMVGARLVLARPEGHRDASYLIKLIRSERITTLHFVPSMLRLFLDEPGVEACRNLRRVICSGEALELSLQEKFFKRLPNVELHNLYGPTEAAVDVTYWRCEPESVRRTVPIGRPISNVQIYLLDEHLQVVPVGVTGELHIGGVGLGRGYWKRPGLTAEKFIPHPHSPVPGERLYKTGDVAQYLPDGNINYLGRADYQVKIRGMRIELGEIETVLAEHSAVEEALVLIREYGPSDNRLVAYLIPDQQHACAVRQLLRLEMQGLPDGQEITELPNGMRIVHRNKGETDFLYSEIFESQAYLKHGITLDEDSCIFDVGANIGLFTLFMGRLCERATIYAFEPIPPVFRMLQANAAIHGMNVKLYECGLSGHSASERFTYYPHCSILSGRFADVKAEAEIIKSFMLNDEQFKRDETLAASADMLDELVEERLTSEEYTCRLRTISEVIEENGIERIDLLKIDVEKSEEDVLAGIKETDWNKIRQIIVEVHDVGGRLNQLTSLLKKHGYVLTVEQDPLLKDTDLYNIYALRPVALANDSDKRETTLQTGTPQKWNSQDDLVGDVQRYLQEKLPDYMIPSQFVLLDELPLTPNGKVDRRALPAPDQTHLQPGSSYVAPSTPEEEILAGIFQQVLKVEQVGVHDNFFTLGGHSLLATQVISRIRHSFQIELPLTALFKSPTVAALSTLIEELIIAEITAEAETELAQ
jgi:amino acid adenylation domain-containing protein/FkbM family methyltransferase